jgi:phosphoserine aminotransferase
MNFLGADQTAGYIDSGHWSSEAVSYAGYYGNTHVLASSKDTNYNRLPQLPQQVPDDLAYLHITTNNTIYGTQWEQLPAAPVPLIADMSSDILSRARKYTDCALFYAVAQKNLGAAGTTMVALRRDMLQRISRKMPPMLDFRQQVKHGSVLNTPPVFPIYTALLMLRWTKQKTIEAIERESILKAEMVWQELERNSLFKETVAVKEHRSRMNICFVPNNPEIQQGFSDFCSRNHITGIEGHRSVGGYRVSLYNGVTLSAVEKLIAVMQEYEVRILNDK